LASTTTYNPTFLTNSGGTAAGAQMALITSLNAGTAYLNIHTTTFAGGEIRAFPEAVPEPLTLMGASAAIGLGAMFKKQRA
ncbi:MAG: hypothetical protein RLZZ490_334, partial [Cyanobacteriota bacterium]